ncbi:MAG: hypothetical protein WCK49_02950 [Myxococcaceae bacterium]
MVARNPRINTTFEEETAVVLAEMARQAHKSVSSVVKELTLEALEMREDFYLSRLANKLDQEGVRTFSHDDAWK